MQFNFKIYKLIFLIHIELVFTSSMPNFVRRSWIYVVHRLLIGVHRWLIGIHRLIIGRSFGAERTSRCFTVAHRSLIGAHESVAHRCSSVFRSLIGA